MYVQIARYVCIFRINIYQDVSCMGRYIAYLSDFFLLAL